jgi:hypothetical protein
MLAGGGGGVAALPSAAGAKPMPIRPLGQAVDQFSNSISKHILMARGDNLDQPWR